MDEVGGRKDILAVSLEYSSDPPMSYKLLINSYVSTIRKAAQDAQPAAAPPLPPAAPTLAPDTEASAVDIARLRTVDPSEGDPEDNGSMAEFARLANVAYVSIAQTTQRQIGDFILDPEILLPVELPRGVAAH